MKSGTHGSCVLGTGKLCISHNHIKVYRLKPFLTRSRGAQEGRSHKIAKVHRFKGLRFRVGDLGLRIEGLRACSEQ